MIQLTDSLKAWGSPDFRQVLENEIEQLDISDLPLQQGLSQTSMVSDSRFSVMIIDVREEADSIGVKAGIFYQGVIAGCSCADDPTPVTEQSEYCEIRFDIDRQTAETTVTLLPDPVEGSG